MYSNIRSRYLVGECCSFIHTPPPSFWNLPVGFFFFLYFCNLCMLYLCILCRTDPTRPYCRQHKRELDRHIEDRAEKERKRPLKDSRRLGQGPLLVYIVQYSTYAVHRSPSDHLFPSGLLSPSALSN